MTKQLELAERLSRISEPQTIKMAKLSRELKAQGIDIVDLSIGEPDFDTPVHIREAAKKAIDEGFTHYTPVAGFADLKQAVAKKLLRDNGLEYTPDQIVVSTGAKQSIANTVLSVINPGDEVIIPTPYWVTYSELVKLCQGEVKFIPCGIENKYKITPAQLEAAITPKTKLFMFSSPCNPTGSVYSKEELKGLADVFARYPGIYIMADEIYEYINFVGKHESIATFSDLKDRIILINGLSRGFAMTGWRLGWLLVPTPLQRAVDRLTGNFSICPPTLPQLAAVAAFTPDSLAEADALVERYTLNREKLLTGLAAIGLDRLAPADGAFYVYADVSDYSTDSLAFCAKLLAETGVAIAPGVDFDTVHGGAYVRLSFAGPTADIDEALRRIGPWLSE